MAFGVTVDFNANIAKFSSQVDKISTDLSRFSNKTESTFALAKTAFRGFVGAFGVVQFSNFIRGGIDTADMLGKLADRTGIAVENLAGLKLAADISDTSLEEVGRSINKLSIFMGQNADAARQLGITAKEPIDAFLQFSDVFSGIQDDAERAAVGNRVLGESYANLAPLLRQGSAALREQIEQGREYLPVTDAMAKRAAAFNDSMTKLAASSNRFALGLSGPVTDAANSFAETLAFTSDRIKELGGGWGGFFDYLANGSALVQTHDRLKELNEAIKEQQDLVSSIEGDSGLSRLFGPSFNVESTKLFNLIAERNKVQESLKISVEPKLSKPEVDLSAFKQSEDKISQFLEGGKGVSKTGKAKGAADADKTELNLNSRAAAIYDQTRTSLERLLEKKSEYKTLLDAGKISLDTFTRAMRAANDEYNRGSDSVDQGGKSLDQIREEIRLRQAEIDAKNPFLQARLRTTGQTDDPRYNAAGDKFNFGAQAQAQELAASVTKEIAAQPPIELPKFNEDSVLSNAKSINQKLREYFEANPITQYVNVVANTPDGQAEIDAAAIAAGTR